MAPNDYYDDDDDEEEEEVEEVAPKKRVKKWKVRGILTVDETSNARAGH
jgi:hypothetical protein